LQGQKCAHQSPPVRGHSLVSMNTAYMLMDLGHSVLEATSGVQTLRVLEGDSQFHVVVTD
jgi:CheY-like chemotaxis protein